VEGERIDFLCCALSCNGEISVCDVGDVGGVGGVCGVCGDEAVVKRLDMMEKDKKVTRPTE